MRVKPSFSYLLQNCKTPKYATPIPTLNHKLTKYAKQSTPPLIFRALYQSVVREEYPDFTKIFTDGSKSNDGVVAAAIQLNFPASCLASLPKEASIYSAESYAVQMAVDHILRINQINLLPSPNKKYAIFTDSKSVFDSLNIANDHPTIRYIIHKLHVIRAQGIQVEICWIPSHLGIEGNEKADLKAKEASRRTPELIPVYYKDFYPVIQLKMKLVREQNWSQSSNKLRAIKKDLKPWPSHDLHRREEIIMNRLRIGHTNLTHCHLMDSAMMNGPPVCFACNNHTLTVEC